MYSHMLIIRVSAAVQGMVFKPFCQELGIETGFLVRNRVSNISKFRIKGFAKTQFRNRCYHSQNRSYFVKTQQLMYKHILNKNLLQNLPRTGYAFLALSQEQGIILKLFLVRVGIWGSQQHTSTLKFGEYPHPQELHVQTSKWTSCQVAPLV